MGTGGDVKGLVGFLCKPQPAVGMPALPLVLMLMAAVPAAPAVPMAEPEFQQLLLEGDLIALEQACRDAQDFGLDQRLQQLRERLLGLHPRPEALDLVLANAQALMTCRSPESAGVVLNRYSPGQGVDWRRWLLLRWQAAAAALDHRQAALALRRLVKGDLAALERETLLGSNGLEQLAEHEAASGRTQAAVDALLSGSSTGVAGARRLARAAELLGQTEMLAEEASQADQLLEQAIELAASEEAWGLAVELLQLQLRLQMAYGGDGVRPRERLEQLTARLDDRYGYWRRQSGGHAAVGDTSDAAAP